MAVSLHHNYADIDREVVAFERPLRNVRPQSRAPTTADCYRGTFRDGS
jgi:hypothetical protein